MIDLRSIPTGLFSNIICNTYTTVNKNVLSTLFNVCVCVCTHRCVVYMYACMNEVSAYTSA